MVNLTAIFNYWLYRLTTAALVIMLGVGLVYLLRHYLLRHFLAVHLTAQIKRRIWGFFLVGALFTLPVMTVIHVPVLFYQPALHIRLQQTDLNTPSYQEIEQALNRYKRLLMIQPGYSASEFKESYNAEQVRQIFPGLTEQASPYAAFSRWLPAWRMVYLLGLLSSLIFKLYQGMRRRRLKKLGRGTDGKLLIKPEDNRAHLDLAKAMHIAQEKETNQSGTINRRKRQISFFQDQQKPYQAHQTYLTDKHTLEIQKALKKWREILSQWRDQLGIYRSGNLVFTDILTEQTTTFDKIRQYLKHEIILENRKAEASDEVAWWVEKSDIKASAALALYRLKHPDILMLILFDIVSTMFWFIPIWSILRKRLNLVLYQSQIETITSLIKNQSKKSSFVFDHIKCVSRRSVPVFIVWLGGLFLLLFILLQLPLTVYPKLNQIEYPPGYQEGFQLETYQNPEQSAISIEMSQTYDTAYSSQQKMYNPTSLFFYQSAMNQDQKDFPDYPYTADPLSQPPVVDAFDNVEQPVINESPTDKIYIDNEPGEVLIARRDSQENIQWVFSLNHPGVLEKLNSAVAVTSFDLADYQLEGNTYYILGQIHTLSAVSYTKPIFPLPYVWIKLEGDTGHLIDIQVLTQLQADPQNIRLLKQGDLLISRSLSLQDMATERLPLPTWQDLAVQAYVTVIECYQPDGKRLWQLPMSDYQIFSKNTPTVQHLRPVSLMISDQQGGFYLIVEEQWQIAMLPDIDSLERRLGRSQIMPEPENDPLLSSVYLYAEEKLYRGISELFHFNAAGEILSVTQLSDSETYFSPAAGLTAADGTLYLAGSLYYKRPVLQNPSLYQALSLVIQAEDGETDQSVTSAPFTINKQDTYSEAYVSAQLMAINQNGKRCWQKTVTDTFSSRFDEIYLEEETLLVYMTSIDQRIYDLVDEDYKAAGFSPINMHRVIRFDLDGKQKAWQDLPADHQSAHMFSFEKRTSRVFVSDMSLHISQRQAKRLQKLEDERRHQQTESMPAETYTTTDLIR